MKKLLLGLLFVITAYQTKAGFDYSDNLRKSFQCILRLRLNEARIYLEKEKKEQPSNSLTLLYANYYDFIKAFITEEQKYADTLRLNTERRLRLLDLERGNSPYLLLAKADMLIQTAMIKAKFGENVSAALDIRKAYNYAERNFILYPTFPLNKKTLGLLHAMVGAIPHEYKWLVSIAGMEGTIPQGSDELFRMLAETDEGFFPEYKEEVLFYLVQIYSSITTNDSITALLAGAVKKHAENSPLMMYCFTNLTYKSGRNEEALAIMNTFDDDGIFPFYFLHYKKAQLRLRKLDLGAEEDFEYYLAHFKGLNYVKSAYQKLAWIALLRNDDKKYKQILEQCFTKGITLVDEDKEALKEFETKEIPNPVLLRARLLFDGGYYKESFREMVKITSPTVLPFKDKLEYTYRYGRLFHKTGDFPKAILNYSATLQNGETSHYYFAANAALMLGQLYEEQKDWEKARTFYNRCLELRHHDYQNSIDQKAQAALERLAVK
ncbi:MAG: tetratricopeptide repeat protein [Bacteroidota bacterium]